MRSSGFLGSASCASRSHTPGPAAKRLSSKIGARRQGREPDVDTVQRPGDKATTDYPDDYDGSRGIRVKGSAHLRHGDAEKRVDSQTTPDERGGQPEEVGG